MLNLTVRLPHDHLPKPHGECIKKTLSDYPLEEQQRMLTAIDRKSERNRITAARNKAKDEAKRKKYKERMK